MQPWTQAAKVTTATIAAISGMDIAYPLARSELRSELVVDERLASQAETALGGFRHEPEAGRIAQRLRDQAGRAVPGGGLSPPGSTRELVRCGSCPLLSVLAVRGGRVEFGTLRARGAAGPRAFTRDRRSGGRRHIEENASR